MNGRLVVGITGASGAAYGVRLLGRARALGVTTHLVATPAGVLNVHHELGLDRAALEALADEAHNPADIGACIASGSFAADGMVVAPCSMKSLAAIAHGFGDNLLTRAADVMLKERRRVVLFMKGTAQFPMCGFSGRAVQILKACNVDDLTTVNVLEDEDIRQGIKNYANWPTIPQLYVNGEFVGGSDIMMEMYQAGELQQVLGKA